MMSRTTKIVCLGGGIGTVNLIKGLKEITEHITVLVSTADDGGSAGRLRRLYGITPPGDAISCLSALLTGEDAEKLAEFLTYRFPGDRYGKDDELAGQKLGSLMLVAARDMTGSFEEGLLYLKKIFHACGTILPATVENLHLSAVTKDGVHVDSEENIDLGKYTGERILENVSITPDNPTVSEHVIRAIDEADVIIAGPGDLYTTVLPILLIPKIHELVEKYKDKTVYVLNVANKPFETKGYKASDFVKSITSHLGSFPFKHIVINTNTSVPIPSEYAYTYVENDLEENPEITIIQGDFVSTQFPLYHDSSKLATTLSKRI